MTHLFSRQSAYQMISLVIIACLLTLSLGSVAFAFDVAVFVDPTTAFSDVKVIALVPDETGIHHSLYATLSDQYPVSGIAQLYLPMDIIIDEAVGISPSGESLGPIQYEYDADRTATFDIYSFTITNGEGVRLSFTIPESVSGTGFDGLDEVVAQLSIGSPFELNSLSIGFEAPPGMSPSEPDVVTYKDAASGATIHSKEFTNVPGGEFGTATITFVRDGAGGLSQDGDDAGGSGIASFGFNRWWLVPLLVALILAALWLCYRYWFRKEEVIREDTEATVGDGKGKGKGKGKE